MRQALLFIALLPLLFRLDMFDISDDDIKSKCEGADVFFCCLGTTRSAAGSAVRMSERMHACISLS